MLETRQDRSLDYVLARRMTRISAVKIIYIYNKLIQGQSSHKVTHFRGQLFQLPDTWWPSLWRVAYSPSFVFVQSKWWFLHKHFTCKKCFCYVFQRQTTFSPHNNPPFQRNCKLLCHNDNWAITPDPLGGAVASWLVCSTPERAVRVRALAGDIVLCSWARNFTLTVPLSTQVYKWVLANLMLGVTLQWTSIPSRGSRNTLSRSMLRKPG